MRSFIILFLISLCGPKILAQQDTVFVTIRKSASGDDANFKNAFGNKSGKFLKIKVLKGEYQLSENIITARPNTRVVCENDAVIHFTSEQKSGFTVVHDGFLLQNADIRGNGIPAKDFYTGYGVLLNGASGCTIKSCKFSNISGNNVMLFPTSAGIGCSDNVISGNDFGNPAKNNPAADTSFILLGYSGKGYSHDRNRVDGNTMDGNFVMKIGIGFLGHGNNNEFTNNTIKNVLSYGIASYESAVVGDTMSGTIISGNEIRNVGEVAPKKTVKGMGIYLMTAINSTVKNNKVYNALLNSDQTETLGAGAISVSLSLNTTVDGNLIDGSYMYGIVSDYSFGSSFSNNTVRNVRKSGAYFINMNDILVSGNKFSNIGEVFLKGYFENTSLPYIKEQMRSTKYMNIDTGQNFKITNNSFEGSNDILYFNGTPPEAAKKYPGNKVRGNIFEKNMILNNKKPTSDIVNFRNAGNNIVR